MRRSRRDGDDIPGYETFPDARLPPTSRGGSRRDAAPRRIFGESGHPAVVAVVAAVAVIAATVAVVATVTVVAALVDDDVGDGTRGGGDGPGRGVGQ